MKIFLSSYDPIIKYKECRLAIIQHEIPPYVDRSCRREPDFESLYPSITALCRRGKFVPRLSVEDVVIYRTNKAIYPPLTFRHWRVVAVLRVKHVFASHKEAAEWYRKKSIPVPSNCMIAGSRPLPLELTIPLAKTRNRFNSLFAWDSQYRKRALDISLFAVCEPLFIELENPPIHTDADDVSVFGRQRTTRTPPVITLSEYRALLSRHGVRI
jgi:hypothetical protein